MFIAQYFLHIVSQVRLFTFFTNVDSHYFVVYESDGNTIIQKGTQRAQTSSSATQFFRYVRQVVKSYLVRRRFRYLKESFNHIVDPDVDPDHQENLMIFKLRQSSFSCKFQSNKINVYNSLRNSVNKPTNRLNKSAEYHITSLSD